MCVCVCYVLVPRPVQKCTNNAKLAVVIMFCVHWNDGSESTIITTYMDTTSARFSVKIFDTSVARGNKVLFVSVWR